VDVVTIERGGNMEKTIYVCSVCGETTADWDTDDDWLIANVPGSTSGEMVIRCPKHITEYAIRKAGGRVEGGKGIVNNWEYDLS